MGEGAMTAPAGAIGELEFLTKLQRILNEGLFVASYKVRLAPSGNVAEDRQRD